MQEKLSIYKLSIIYHYTYMTLKRNIKNQVFFHLCTQIHNQLVFWQEIWSELETLLVYIFCIKKTKTKKVKYFQGKEIKLLHFHTAQLLINWYIWTPPLVTKSKARQIEFNQIHRLSNQQILTSHINHYSN